MQLAGHPRITIDPAICGGRPVVTGTRMRISEVLDLLSNGVTESEIAADFPYLNAADIRACLSYAASFSDHPVVIAAE
jgi:uncharacterized protein (DUF433 family)